MSAAPRQIAWPLMALLAGIFVACGSPDRDATTLPPDRRPYRCYTLRFAEWQSDGPTVRMDMDFLPRGVELDAVLIDPRTPALGLRVNTLQGERSDIASSWRPISPDNIRMDFTSPGNASERQNVTVMAHEDGVTLTGTATTAGAAKAAVSGNRVPCR